MLASMVKIKALISARIMDMVISFRWIIPQGFFLFKVRASQSAPSTGGRASISTRAWGAKRRR
jgi:hypothetical protein